MKKYSFRNRLFSDYFMPSRLREYEDLVVSIKDAGYLQTSVISAWSTIISLGNLESTFVHRHDVDTDVSTAKKMFHIERKHGVYSTYYFRLTTLDVGFMREIEEYGSEASYHFEELATHAKKFHIKSPEILLDKIDLIRKEFSHNLERIRIMTGLPCQSVASHGDFANRKLGLVNQLILDDKDFRKKCNIKIESYDNDLMKFFDSRISDRPYPDFWYPESPLSAMSRNLNNILLLSHPRQWQSNFLANSRESIVRAYEGIRW